MKIPQHIAIVMDGNRRWAKQRNLPTLEGHRKGLENFKKIARYCHEIGVKQLTVFAFSTENWKRSSSEKSYLLKLFLKGFSSAHIKELKQRKVRFRAIGQIEKFPDSLCKKIREAEELTRDNKEFFLHIALSYGGRADILEATKNIVANQVPVANINEQLFSRFLWTQEAPDPDLIIRTGKVKRISNFLLWQSAYAELFFPEKHWPEFSTKDLDKIIGEYAERERRFGT